MRCHPFTPSRALALFMPACAAAVLFAAVGCETRQQDTTRPNAQDPAYQTQQSPPPAQQQQQQSPPPNQPRDGAR